MIHRCTPSPGAGTRRTVDVTLTRRGARWVRRNVRRFQWTTYALRARVRDGRAPRNVGVYGGIIDRVAR
jgi:hypothetical protein